MVMLVTIIFVKRRPKMKVFVTGVAGQLGHDVMNDLVTKESEQI